MDNKKLGLILIIAGIVLVAAIFLAKYREDIIIHAVVAQEGSCFLDDGTCLHEDREMTWYIVGWIISAAIVALGAYLMFFEKSQKEIISTLEKQKHILVEEEKFDILSKGLSEDEKKILNAVKEQDGITQQTLRLRVDMHKSKLSIVLDGMEQKGLVKKVPKGKTNQIFLKIAL